MRIFLLYLSLILIAGCESDSEKERRAKWSHRDYNETKEGVRYFKVCIDGFEFIATNTTHGYETLAGPIGDCK